MALAAVQPQPVTLDALIANAVERHGEEWQRHNPCNAHPFTVFVFGQPLDERRIVFELHDNKTIASMEAHGLKRVFAPLTPTDFYRKVRGVSKPAPVITPRPPVYNGLKVLHDLGRPFDWVDLHFNLELTPAHAKATLAELIMRKKVREVPRVFGGPTRYEVITQNSPDLFPSARVDDAPEWDEYSAEWLIALELWG